MEITAKTERLVTYYYITTLMLGQWGDQGVVMGPVFAVHTPSQGGGGPGAGRGRAHRSDQMTWPRMARGEHQAGPLSATEWCHMINVQE